MAVQPIPAGYHTVTPYLLVNGADRLIEFAKAVFDAEETERLPGPNDTIMHAEIRIGDSIIMIGEPPSESDLMPASVYLYLHDVDAAFQRAIEAGATAVMEPADQFYGDRLGGVKDMCGNIWWLAQRVEEVSPEELLRRAKAKIAS